MVNDDPSSPEAVGERIALTIQALGLSPAAFAKRLRTTHPNVSNWTAGARPNLAAAINLCEVFNLTLDWIYRGKVSGLPHELVERIEDIQADVAAEDDSRSHRQRRA